MIVNTGKFQAIFFDKCIGNHTNQITNIDQKEIMVGQKLNFPEYKLMTKLISIIIQQHL